MVEISNVVAGSINGFIDYALWITAILVIYYGIRFALGTEKKEETGDGEGWGKLKDWWDKATDKTDSAEKEAKKKDEEKDKAKKAADIEKQRDARKKKLDAIRAFLLKAIEDCTDFRNGLTGSNRQIASREATTALRDLTDHVNKVISGLKNMRRREKNTKVHSFLNSLYRSSGVASKIVKRMEIPPVNALNWIRMKGEERKEALHVKNICNVILKRIDDYITNEKKEDYNAELRIRKEIEARMEEASADDDEDTSASGDEDASAGSSRTRRSSRRSAGSDEDSSAGSSRTRRSSSRSTGRDRDASGAGRDEDSSASGDEDSSAAPWP
jgi:hypothetical protein